MRVVFLGTGGYHPNERRHTAGVLLPELGLLLDAGTGLFRLADRLERDDLTIVLSHAHLDHVCGLTYLLVPLHIGRIARLRVFAEQRALDTVRGHLFAPALFPVLPGCEFQPLDGAPSLDLAGRATVTHHPLISHPGGAVGFRVEWSEPGSPRRKSLAYITDTTVDGTYTEFIRGVDLLIHECYFTDANADWAAKTGHSHTSAVARLARDAKVRRLLLTHIDPQQSGDDPCDLTTARAIFPATDLAEDLLTVEV
jgi:ribonuclease Z